MKKANTNIDKKSLPFSKRVKQVESHVAKKIAGLSVDQKYAVKARLWVSWLNREVLL